MSVSILAEKIMTLCRIGGRAVCYLGDGAMVAMCVLLILLLLHIMLRLTTSGWVYIPTG